MGRIQLDDDFRSALEAAVAYRMVEMYSISPEVARFRAHDFVIKGHNSDFSHQVVSAGFDLFEPMISAAMPMIRLIIQQAIIDVKSQIDRGQRTEEAKES